MGRERLGLELASHGEGRDCLQDAEGRAALAGGREVADADLVAGERQGPLGPELHRENLRLAEEHVAVEHRHADPGAGRRGGAAQERRGAEHRHGGNRRSWRLGGGEGNGGSVRNARPPCVRPRSEPRVLVFLGEGGGGERRGSGCAYIEVSGVEGYLPPVRSGRRVGVRSIGPGRVACRARVGTLL